MAYPRACPVCERSYAGAREDAPVFAVLAGHEGGTPSPWEPGMAGRLLDIRCMLCGAVYRWDYFGRGSDPKRLGVVVPTPSTPDRADERASLETPAVQRAAS